MTAHCCSLVGQAASSFTRKAFTLNEAPLQLYIVCAGFPSLSHLLLCCCFSCVCVGSACFKLVRRVLIYDPPSFLSPFTKRLPLKMYQLSSTSLEEIRQWVSNGFHISDTLKLIFFALKNDVEREKISKRMENWNLPLEYRAYLMPIPLNISTGHAYTIILFFFLPGSSLLIFVVAKICKSFLY